MHKMQIEYIHAHVYARTVPVRYRYGTRKCIMEQHSTVGGVGGRSVGAVCSLLCVCALRALRALWCVCDVMASLRNRGGHKVVVVVGVGVVSEK